MRSLDGIWNFARSDQTNPTEGVREGWYKNDLATSRPTIPMPVPASYNDITTDQALRDHVGTVWYDRKFFVPRSWQQGQRVWLRFGSVHYEAFVVSSCALECWAINVIVAFFASGSTDKTLLNTKWVTYHLKRRLLIY